MIPTEAEEVEELLWELLDKERLGEVFSAGQLSSWALSAIQEQSRADSRLSGYTRWQGFSERDSVLLRQVGGQLSKVLETAIATGAIRKVGLHTYVVCV